MFSKKNLIWLDLEMTGLDPDADRILEIATVVTDSQLRPIATGPELVIRQSQERLAAMDEWNRNQHGGSGLIEAVLNSDCDETQAQRQTLEFLAEHVPPGKSPMCGNSICMDRRFLARWMPELEAFFHYRNLDVSTLKLLVRLWAPAVAEQAPKKGEAHRALQDVMDSIAELAHYRRHFLAPDYAGDS